MIDIEKDVDSFKKLLSNPNKSFDGFSKIYRNTNENISSILSHIDVKGKDVLSVLGSSDQLFSFLCLGANSVNTFDFNRLTIYYFYLKKWSIMHTGNYYLSADNKVLLESLECANNTYEEQHAKLFWQMILSDLKESLYYSNIFYLTSVYYSVPYSNNMDEIKSIIEKAQPNFQYANIFCELLVDNKYDIIYLSNILEYLYDFENIGYDYVVLNNLLNHMKENSIVIASNIMDFDSDPGDVLKKYFEIEIGTKEYSRLYNGIVPCYYTLRLK